MFKHLATIILLSIAVLFAMSQTQHVLEVLLIAHDKIAEGLKQVFSGGEIGNLIRESIALLTLPLLAGLLPAMIFWLIKRRWLANFIYVVWFVWLVQTAALVAIYSPKK